MDGDSLEKVREEMDRDLQAQKAQEIPLVAAARGVAAEMGFIPVSRVEGDFEESSRAVQEHPVSDSLAEALGAAPCLGIVEEEAMAVTSPALARMLSGVARRIVRAKSPARGKKIFFLGFRLTRSK